MLKKYISTEWTILDIGAQDGFFAKKYEIYNIISIDKEDFDVSYDNFSEKYKVDAVTMWQVLEHLENPYHCIREIYKLLPEKGVFIFSTLNTFSIKNKLNFLLKGEMPRYNEKNDHRNIFTFQTLIRFFSGFDVLSWGTCGREYRKIPTWGLFNGETLYLVMKKI